MLVCSVACSIALKQGDGKWRLENDGANSMAGKTTGLGVRFWPGLSFSQPSWLVHHFPVLHFPLSVYVKHHVHSFVQKYSVSLIQLSASCRSQLCSQCYAAVYECFEGLPDISVLWGFTLCVTHYTYSVEFGHISQHTWNEIESSLRQLNCYMQQLCLSLVGIADQYESVAQLFQ